MSENRPLTGVPGTIQVLHVDDEPGLADLTAEYLQRENDRLTVETAPPRPDGPRNGE